MKLFASILLFLTGAVGVTLPAAAQQAPFAPLSPVLSQQLDQVLAAWQRQSEQVERLRCKFERWQFIPGSAPTGKHATYAAGELKYLAPDKGSFKTTSLFFYTQGESGAPEYKQITGRFGDWWVCTGTELMEFDRTDKECVITEIPEAMQGKTIYESSLPFVFNLDAERIKQRFWIRPIESATGQTVQTLQNPAGGKYVFEAYPRRQSDAANYQLVRIHLNARDFTIQALEIYPPNYDAKTNVAYDVYQFSEIEMNWGWLQRAAELEWLKEFIQVKAPSDWRVIRQKAPAAAEQQIAEQPANSLQR